MINIIGIAITTIYTIIAGVMLSCTDDNINEITREMRMEIHTFIR